MQPFRITPSLPVSAMRTYSVKMPVQTHFRPATCEEYGCETFLGGWVTMLSVAQTDLIDALRRSGRPYTEKRGENGMIEFRFEPGTPCFKQSTHRVSLERDPVLIVRDGDWRGNPTGWARRHASMNDWIEDFALHQQRVAEQYGG